MYWIPTDANPADDPSRGKEVRPPSQPYSRWLRILDRGRYYEFDRLVSSQSVSNSSVPSLKELSRTEGCRSTVRKLAKMSSSFELASRKERGGTFERGIGRGSSGCLSFQDCAVKFKYTIFLVLEVHVESSIGKFLSEHMQITSNR